LIKREIGPATAGGDRSREKLKPEARVGIAESQADEPGCCKLSR